MKKMPPLKYLSKTDKMLQIYSDLSEYEDPYLREFLALYENNPFKSDLNPEDAKF